MFESPVSYWDRAHGAGWIAPLEAGVVAACAGVLWLRRPGPWISMAILGLLIVEIWIVRQWLFFFVDS